MVQLTDVLKALGPNAAIVFAASIFMGFLQQRYDGALAQYREAVGDYRSNEHDETRADNLKDQVLAYQRRCKLMSKATLVGLMAAICLASSLIFAALDVMIPKSSIIGSLGISTAVGGFALVIVSAMIVIAEGQVVARLIDDELRDVPDLAKGSGTSTSNNRNR